MKKTVVFLILALTVLRVHAQSLSVSGKVADEKGEALFAARVLLLNPTDSSFLKGGLSDAEGNFFIPTPGNGSYLLKISYIAYGDHFRRLTITDVPLALGVIAMKPAASSLKTITIEGTTPPAKLKGDTTEYNASSVKVNPDANAEDLVNKLPGVTTVDGKVQAQGEDVKQVLVDGKPFFGDDAATVLKNLPAEVIDKIQVFDRKSDQAAFSGFDDGNTTKTINIITKPQFRNGTFGRVYAGHSDDDKWKSGLTLNFFKDQRRISILAQANNINEQNFSSDDLLGVMSSGSQGGRSGGGNRPQGGGGPRGGGRSGGSGGNNDASTFLVDQKNGITTTHAFGINYADKWKKLDFSGSYFFNRTDNISQSSLLRTYISNPGENLTYTENSLNESRNMNHRANFRFEYKIDSLNSFIFQPRFSAQINEGSSSLAGVNRSGDTLQSSTINDFNSELTAISFSAPLLYRHGFKKKGRTLSVNVNPGYNSSTGNKQLSTTSSYFADTLFSDTLNQLADLDKQGYTFSSNVTYTEPLGEKSQLQFTYGNNLNTTSSDKRTNNFSFSDNNYSILDTSLSNTFKSRYLAQNAGSGYRYNKDKWNLNVGVSYQWATLHNEQEFPQPYDLNRTFTSLLPNAMLMYRFTQSKNLRVNYRSQNNAPSVEQLQEVVNNSNPLQLSTGNLQLDQDWQNSLNIRYSAVNTARSTSLFLLLSGSMTQNYIGNHTIIASADTQITPSVFLPAGSQLTRPVNLDGYYNMRSFASYSFPLKKIKSKLNLNVSYTFSRSPGMINDNINYTYNNSTGAGVVLSSNISQNIDFTLSTTSSYTDTRSSLQSSVNSGYLNQNSRLRLNMMPWKGLVLQTEVSDQRYSGLAGSINRNFTLWNAAVAYKFLKDRAAELRLSVYDILNQNNSISRNVTDTYYEDVQTTVLRQYFMLTFTYNIKAFKKMPAGSSGTPPDGETK